MYDCATIVTSRIYLDLPWHSPFVGKHISNKMSMLFFLQRWRLTLFTKGCYFRGCQKHCGSGKGKAECVVSVLVPAVPDSIKLSHIMCFPHHPGHLILQLWCWHRLSAGCSAALHMCVSTLPCSINCRGALYFNLYLIHAQTGIIF